MRRCAVVFMALILGLAIPVTAFAYEPPEFLQLTTHAYGKDMKEHPILLRSNSVIFTIERDWGFGRWATCLTLSVTETRGSREIPVEVCVKETTSQIRQMLGIIDVNSGDRHAEPHP